MECLDDYQGDCQGPVGYFSNPYSDSFKSWPRCEHHFDIFVDRQREIAQRYPFNAPSDFDPLYAGERWEED
jgi:hypothetical protein